MCSVVGCQGKCISQVFAHENLGKSQPDIWHVSKLPGDPKGGCTMLLRRDSGMRHVVNHHRHKFAYPMVIYYHVVGC